MSKIPFTSQVKNSLNTVLRPVGLQIGTTLAQRMETERLKGVEQRGQWSRAPYREGLTFNEHNYFEFLQTVCEPRKELYSSFCQTGDPSGPEYFLQNDWFGVVDAEVLYCIIDHFRPRVIIEVGSGYSTRLMRQAIQESAVKTKLCSIDPSPRVVVAACANEEIRTVVEEVPVSRFAGSLQANDILFIDSSHVIQTGGDVPYVFLEILPRLQAGVLIHVHDIFLPFDYPKKFVDERWCWTEQYLLHAFMLDNSNYEILWPAYYMWQLHRQMMMNIIPVQSPRCAPSSFWIRKLKSLEHGAEP
jgi:hypothetical protein